MIRIITIVLLPQAGLAVNVYQPKKVKLTITGSGAADKKQMQRMVQLTLKLKEALRPDDVADAIAIAVCHLKTAPLSAQINTAAVFAAKIATARKAQIKQ